jgi:hypothetical protein
MSKPKQTAFELRRAAYNRLVATLIVPQRTSIATPQPIKTKPATGRFATV